MSTHDTFLIGDADQASLDHLLRRAGGLGLAELALAQRRRRRRMHLIAVALALGLGGGLAWVLKSEAWRPIFPRHAACEISFACQVPPSSRHPSGVARGLLEGGRSGVARAPLGPQVRPGRGGPLRGR